MSDNFFCEFASGNRLIWSDAVRWPHFCWYGGSCKRSGTGLWPLRKAWAVRASERPYWCTIAATWRHLCGRTGTCRYETTIFRLAVPMPACNPTATYVVHFFQANFELHPYEVEKWVASRWNPQQLKMRRWQLHLWHKLNGKITIQLYNKQNDLNFSIVNFPYLCSNIPASPAYGVYISQLVRCARPYSIYDQLLVQSNLLTNWWHRGFNSLVVYWQLSEYFKVITTILFTHTTFLGPHAVWYVSYQSLIRS
jgi:hypothetical protein